MVKLVAVVVVFLAVFSVVFGLFGDNQPMFWILVFFSGFVSLLGSAAVLDLIDPVSNGTK